MCTWVNQLLAHVLQTVDLFLLWSMNDHGGGAQDAEQATELPMQVQPLCQEVRRQHRTTETCTVTLHRTLSYKQIFTK